ncbi:hypothetical protein ERO13_D11G101450v2 [Gossypium hirsutum]|uniref:Uncharacterized protein n=4 Tax=Gossypium TaxID=3633 RepID=A0A5J5P9F2_GOSBA|nr:hypothetical protein ES319_D11G106200v1 [Gossypium barbadense]KAG4119784.1 hypothetical protein ERO13_D11G101450v2 [Gossypium hirsutum]TYG44637.1 hypothetical protein ES288_D11G111700v1 [Gossypium darwinii]TYH43167.1 hypothetical protein ES332_D11G109900v1 [Gossypium tomentosum]TYI54975.1 hypothetical protein E1A91_D11G109100v1 [Gossypium mustelinum]
MASEAPSWGDQWGFEGIERDGSKKSQGKCGFHKAKTTAFMGAKKLKLGASKAITWVKNKSQKRNSKCHRNIDMGWKSSGAMICWVLDGARDGQNSEGVIGWCS